MQLYVCKGRVIIDGEREQALRDFANGSLLPAPEQRDIETMLLWLERAIASLNPEDETDALRYAGLVLDKQYLRLVTDGLIPESDESSLRDQSHSSAEIPDEGSTPCGADDLK